MNRITRRAFAILVALLLTPPVALHASEPVVKLAVFDVDATPSLGSAMAYDPVKRIDELTLRCRGIALLGATKPVVGCNDEQIGRLLQRFGDKGGDRHMWGGHPVFATNYRMSEPQAAVAATQLTRLEAIAAKRAWLGNLLTEQIAGLPGIVPHEVHPEDRAVYWFYMFRIRPDAFRCGRSAFVKALLAEGAGVTGGYIGVPLYREPVFQQHSFFAGHWPVKEMGLTTMDFTKHHCPEAEAILATCIRVTIQEHMTEEYILGVAAAIEKVARHFAV